MYLKHAIHYIKCFLIDCLKFDKRKRFTVCTEITIILGTVQFTIRGGRLRYKRYDAHFLKKSSYVSRYLICIMIRITIRFIGNCNYSLKSMLVDMFFFICGRLCTRLHCTCMTFYQTYRYTTVI
jgi:hypothetical protein